VTFSLSLTELAGMTYRAHRCVGMRFHHPVSAMKLLEVTRALETDDESVAVAVSVARRLGKEPIVVRESAGSITARVQALIGNEAFALLQEGVASAADIDKAFTLGLKHATGPFSQMDAEGLDNRLHLLERLQQSLGEKFRPHPLLVQYVKAGRLGRKSGKGIFDYPDESRR
jgi:3-hydroxybutyryl-CoA dehydrogenase